MLIEKLRVKSITIILILEIMVKNKKSSVLINLKRKHSAAWGTNPQVPAPATPLSLLISQHNQTRQKRCSAQNIHGRTDHTSTYYFKKLK